MAPATLYGNARILAPVCKNLVLYLQVAKRYRTDRGEINLWI